VEGNESYGELSFLGAKVPGSESSRERKFHGTFVPESESSTLWNFRSRERKFLGTKVPAFFLDDVHLPLMHAGAGVSAAVIDAPQVKRGKQTCTWTTFAMTTANCQECDTVHAGGMQAYRY